jgi:hypothetical protein
MILDTLAQYGFSVTMVQMAIIAAVVIAIVGMFWRIIFAGVIIVSIISIFSSGVSNTPSVNTAVATPVPPALVSEINSAPVMPIVPSKEEQFMQDCQDKADYSLEVCKKIWYSENA